MSRVLLSLVALLAALALAAPAGALAQGGAALPDVEDEVMCTTCNVPLNVAQSPQADRQRAFIRDLIAQGASKEQIKAALVDEYGSEVLALPQDEGFDLAAYLVPIALLAVLLTGLALLIPRWRRRAPGSMTAGVAPAPRPSAAEAHRLEDDLSRYD